MQHQNLRQPSSKLTKGKMIIRTGGAITKDMGSKASTSNQAKTPKSNNKPCKKKREATKKKQGEKQDKNHQEDQEQQDNPCKKFMMVDDQQGMDITPLHAHYITPPPSVPPDKSPTICQINTIPEVDEYGVDNSEDEVVVDN